MKPLCNVLNQETRSLCFEEVEDHPPMHKAWAHYPGQLVVWPYSEENNMAGEDEEMFGVLNSIEHVLYRKSVPSERLAVIRSLVNQNDDAETLRRISADSDLMYTVGRRAVEDVLVEFRDSGISILGRNNGLVIKYPDGTTSDAIRLTIEDALRIGMQAMADHLEKKEKEEADD